MSDQGFDFGPPPERREARQFEPPPWEREQFEQHRKAQAEQEAAAQAVREKVLAEEQAAREAAEALHEAAATAQAEQAAESPERVLGEAEQEPTATPAAKAEVDEKQVAMMMLNLRAEEPVALAGAWLINLVAGAVVALVGFATGIWGAMALAKRNLPVAGTLGGFVLVAFGLGFLGVGGWLIFKALRQRGVL